MDKRKIAEALRLLADAIEDDEAAGSQTAALVSTDGTAALSSRSTKQDYESTLQRLGSRYGHEPFNMVTDKNFGKSAKVDKLLAKQYLHQAKAEGRIVQLDEDGHVWQFPEPWRPVSVDGTETENVYQILRHAFDLKPFNLQQAATAFKDGTPERVAPILAYLVKEEMARQIGDDL